MSALTPPSLSSLLEVLSSYDETQIQSLKEQIAQPTSTRPANDQIASCAQVMGVDRQELQYIFALLTFLYDQTEGFPDAQVRSAIAEFVKDSDADLEGGEDKLVKTIIDLLSYRENFAKSAKKMRLSRGVLPFVTKTASFVDLRSDFERDGDGKLTGDIVDTLPIVQLAITVTNVDDDSETIVLQLDENSLAQFEDTLGDIRKKINILKSK